MLSTTIMKKGSKFLFLTLLGFALFFANSAQAQQTANWNYTLAIYMWLPGIDGTVGAMGSTVDVDASFSDLAGALKFGVMSGIRAQKGKVAITGDFIYTSLGITKTQGPVKIDIDIKPWMLAGDLGYAVAKDLEILGGVRFSKIENTLDFKSPLPLKLQANQSWVDPIVGIRYIPRLSKRWSLLTRADIGGFGIGSDLTYQIAAHAVFDISTKASIAFGYRLLDVDFKEENGDQFVVDMGVTGPSVGFLYRF